MAQAADAKVRVCIYGSPQVIERLSAFEATGAAINSAESAKLILDLLSAMRKDTGMRNDGISHRDFHNIVIGPKY